MIVNFFIKLFNSFYQILPDSFIQGAGFADKYNVQLVANLLPALNWFVPFDLALYAMTVWLPCILLYYVSGNVRTVIKKLARIFIDKL